MIADLTIPVDHESSDVCGERFTSDLWARLHLHEAWVDDSYAPTWSYLHVPYDLPLGDGTDRVERVVYRVRLRWYVDTQVRIGGLRLRIVAVTPKRLDVPTVAQAGWHWVVDVAP